MNNVYSNGTVGWNIDKLFKIAENIEEKDFDIESFDLNHEDYQWSKNKNTIEDALWHFQKIHNVDLSFAILIDNKTGKIFDGWHRIIKAKILKR